MRRNAFDAAVVGGGAAGMFAAICAAENGLRVLILEKNERLGRKLAITGKGRCNVTNDCAPEEVLKNVPRNGRFLYSCVNAFPPTAMQTFLEAHGCPLKTERGNRVFPVSDRSADVIAALERELRRLNVTRSHTTVTGIAADDNGIMGVKTADGPVAVSRVILCTGGLSYPATGSTGDGYRFAQALGHTVAAPEASLVPLVSDCGDCAQMQGLSLRNTGFQLLNGKGKAVFKGQGELLFTHFGLSGPLVLSASAHRRAGETYRVALDLKPALDEGKLDARFLRDFELYANRSMENALADLFPRLMIPVLLKRSGIDPAMKANSLTKAQRHALLENTKRFIIPISGTRPVEEAIITRGGISVKEIDPKTMASKLVDGLYFAGEIIDCDAYTGGFNLQIAWSTAYAAAKGCAERGV